MQHLFFNRRHPMLFSENTNILITHRQPLINFGLAAFLNEQPRCNITTFAYPVSKLNPTLRFDIIISDYETGIELASRFRGETHIPDSAPRILIVTTFDREGQVSAAINSGVQGYILQSCTHEELLLALVKLKNKEKFICQALSQVAISGLSRESLTPREHGVLGLLAKGKCNRTIAKNLGITVETAKTHVRAILYKLDATSRTEAAIIAMNRGLVGNHIMP